MEDALTVWRALEGKYGPLRDIMFLRDPVNKLKLAPSCIALFDKPFPPDFDYAAQTFAVELPTEVPENGGPGIAAIHKLLSGPSYTVDVPKSQVETSEPSDTSADDTTSSPHHAQAFSLRESSGSNPRIVTVKGSRPNSPYRVRYSPDAPRPASHLGPQHSFARLWAAFGGFAPSDAPPNMRMARTMEVAREFVVAHAQDAPVVADDRIQELIDAAQLSQPLPETADAPPVLELEETRSHATVETIHEDALPLEEDSSADEPLERSSWSPITSDPSTLVSAVGGRISTRGIQLSKEERMEQQALAALEKARAAEAAEKARVAALNRNTRAAKAAAAEKEKRHSKKQEMQRAKRTAAGSPTKSAKLPVSGARAAQRPTASQPKAAAPAGSEAPRQPATSAPGQQDRPAQRKGLLGRLLGW
ncbi:unnamed protein product [Peniophora sp. CBMAI 1063]|nr:unnamed protein product [Peniophora sp. CBMAI 1063]